MLDDGPRRPVTSGFVFGGGRFYSSTRQPDREERTPLLQVRKRRAKWPVPWVGTTPVTGVDPQKDGGFPGVARFPQGDHGTGFGLLEWTLASASHGAPIFGSGRDDV